MSGPIRILYVLRNRFGTLGSNSSFMVPAVAHRDFAIKVVDFESNEAEQGRIVYANAEIERSSYPRLPAMLRLPVVRAEIESFGPDIVHHFYHNCSFAFPFFLRNCLADPPRYIIDIRSPPVNQDDETRLRDVKRNDLAGAYCDVIATHAMESAAKLIPGAGANLLYAPPGVSVGQFKFREQSAPSPVRRFVYTGSLAESRKLETLIECFSALVRNASVPVTLDIFGDGLARPKLQACARSLGVASRITFHGQVMQSALAERLRTFDAGIAYVPKEWFGEAPALKFLEYAASGLAVFASETPGLKKQQQDGMQVEWFAHDPDSFCAAALPWTAAPYPVSVLGGNRRYAESQDWERLVKRDYYPVYRRLAEERRKARHVH